MKMDYIKSNKEAWEEAFDNRHPNWGDENYKRLMNEKLPFFNADVVCELNKIDFSGKTVAQFCCNNGRELLSLMQLNPEYGIGFDVAENILEQARDTAKKVNITNCNFVNTNILDINETYYNKFDFILFTIGALCWFKDLNALFDVVSKCLKKGGKLLINEHHPFFNMIPMEGQKEFDTNILNRLSYPYFKDEPWVENGGMSYISPLSKSKTFTSFSHTMSSIINSVINSGMNVKKLDEYDYDIGLTDVYDKKGYPLSFILIAQKY